MTNPLISNFLDYLRILYSKDISQAVCEYNYPDICVKISLYPYQEGSNSSSFEKDMKEVSLDNFSDSVSFFTGCMMGSGTERNGLFNLMTHRKIKSFRLFLPSWKAQIDYDDTDENIDFSVNVQEKIRDMFEVIK